MPSVSPLSGTLWDELFEKEGQIMDPCRFLTMIFERVALLMLMDRDSLIHVVVWDGNI